MDSGNATTRLLQKVLRGDEAVRRRAEEAPAAWSELLLESRRLVLVPAGSDAQSPPPQVVFPGSFNPLHHGHVRMAEIASERLHETVWFEISTTNVDKPPLDFLAIRERLDGLTGYNVCLTRAPTFVEKADLFPAAVFVVGADTLARIADAKYYDASPENRDTAIARLEQADVRFLVFGRSCGGRFITLADLSLPPRLAARCEGIPEAEFRDDISSTSLRAGPPVQIPPRHDDRHP